MRNTSGETLEKDERILNERILNILNVWLKVENEKPDYFEDIAKGGEFLNGLAPIVRWSIVTHVHCKMGIDRHLEFWNVNIWLFEI